MQTLMSCLPESFLDRLQGGKDSPIFHHHDRDIMDNNCDDRMTVDGVVAGVTGRVCFVPSEEQRTRSRLGDLEEFWRMHKKSLENPDEFWSELADDFYWKVPPPRKNIHNYNFDVRKGKIFMEWMKGGTTNICYNALDRNIQRGFGNNIAYFWEGNDPQDSDTITYKELLDRVCKFANVLKSKGVRKGDVVTLYMPMVLELVIAMYACARIGAIHSVVFGGYSSEALMDRILGGKSKILVTADGYWRGPKFVHLKSIADKTVQLCRERNHHVASVIIVEHQMRLKSTTSLLGGVKKNTPRIVNGYNLEINFDPKIDSYWNDEMGKVSNVCEPVWVDSEHILFTLYTSGSTGVPKGCVHTTGAYMVYGAVSFKYIFDHQPGDVFFCTGDIGWLTGHTYIVYGSLLNAASCVLFEGIPTHPDVGRYWQMVEKYKATQFYTAPTAIRTLMRYDDSYVTKYNRSTLRVLACVGEPMNQDAWFWFFNNVGEGRCPIVDTFWQTETGGILLTPIPFCTPLKPGCASLPFFGVEPAILDDDGNEIKGPGKGFLAFKRPWPPIMRTIYNNHPRYEKMYFETFPGYYFTGDGGMRDEDGFYWVTGRVDDYLNVSGHLLSTSQIEAALVCHPHVAETAVVRRPHPVKGHCLYCFIVMKDGHEFDSKVVQELTEQVERQIGRFARPEYFQHAAALPKTRSGKTVRRILRKIAENDRDLGDISTLLDETVVQDLFDSRKFVYHKQPIQVD